jgi:hypothetical protein
MGTQYHQYWLPVPIRPPKEKHLVGEGGNIDVFVYNSVLNIYSISAQPIEEIDFQCIRIVDNDTCKRYAFCFF